MHRLLKANLVTNRRGCRGETGLVNQPPAVLEGAGYDLRLLWA